MFDDEKKLNEQEDVVADDTKNDVITENQNQPEYIATEDNETEEKVSAIVEDTADELDSAQSGYVNDSEEDQSYYGQTDNNSDAYADNNSGAYNSGDYVRNDTRAQYYNYSNNEGFNQDNMQNNNSNKNNKTIAIVATVAVVAIVFVGGIKIVTDNFLNNANKVFEGIEETTVSDEVVEYPSIESTADTNQSNSTNSGGFVITDVSNIVEDCMPSIVSITSTTIVESTDWSSGWPFFDYGYGQSDQGYEEQVGAGSGIIVKQTESELLIVTNNHVVSGADSLSIQFVNGTSIDGVTKSTDEAADIAIVSIPLADIDSDTLDSIKLATLGSSDDTKVGEGVVAIGNALGYGQSVTTGVISAKEREIAVDNQTMVVLQTDAAINGGNSGGALINSAGEVIGINVAKYSSSSYSGSASVEGMGFAIPVSQATDIINSLMSRETREKVDEKEKGALGIMGVAVDSSVAEAYSIPQGIYIREVIAGGAAEKAGLRATDVITKFDEQTVSTMESLQEKLEYYKAGETVTLTIYRNTNGGYQETQIDVTLSSATILDETETN